MKRVALAFALLACRADTKAPVQVAADPPVSTPSAVPEAPVSGTIHGAPFVARDMRWVLDDRIGYARVDLALSAGKAESACGEIAPAKPASVWLRLEGKHEIRPNELRLDADVDASAEEAWTVHYQVFDGDHWVGLAAKKALLVLHGVSPDGRLAGGLAVCFGDEQKSCVSGSFDATSCPPRIDQPVRGTQQPERIPKEYLERMLLDGGAP